MKICVVTPRFAISGVPLAQMRFAQALARQGHNVDLLIGIVNSGVVLPNIANVNVLVLKRPKVRGMLLPLWNYFRKRRPDVVFSAEDHLNAVALFALILAGSRAKFSGSSRVTPYDTYSNKLLSKRWLLKGVVRALMWRANVLTCVSEGMVEQYRSIFHNAPHKCVYNIIDNELARKKMQEPVDLDWLTQKEIPVVVAAGQLEPWKGFDDLIRAFEIVARSREVRLVIFGEGSLRGQLETMISELGLGDRVKLPGNVSNPLKYFSQADLFVLSSHVEGMPNALVEAIMCGCTPVATDCQTGPRELLHNGKYGYLVKVGDPASIAEGILTALERPITKELLAEAITPFEESTVINRHFELLGLKEPRAR